MHCINYYYYLMQKYKYILRHAWHSNHVDSRKKAKYKISSGFFHLPFNAKKSHIVIAHHSFSVIFQAPLKI